MKRTLFILILSVFVFLSCNKNEVFDLNNPAYPNMRLWALVFCSSDLDYNEDSPVKWKEKVLDSLEIWNFNVLSNHLGFKEQEPFIGCGNCRRTGDYLDVIVPENQKEDLKKLGFKD